MLLDWATNSLSLFCISFCLLILFFCESVGLFLNPYYYFNITVDGLILTHSLRIFIKYKGSLKLLIFLNKQRKFGLVFFMYNIKKLLSKRYILIFKNYVNLMVYSVSM